MRVALRDRAVLFAGLRYAAAQELLNCRARRL